MARLDDRWHLSRPRRGTQLLRRAQQQDPLVPSSEHGQGKRWQVRYRDADGQQRKENFEKKVPADARAAEVETDLNRAAHRPAAGRETFRTRAEDWRTSAIHRERTGGRVERTLRLHLYPTFGSRGIASIKRSEVQTWVKSQATRYEPSTVGSHFEVLGTVMRMAVIDGVIRVIGEGVKLPEKRSKLVIPHPLAVQALIKAAPSRYRALVRLAASSGLRQGELFGLQDGLDFLRRQLEVSQQLITPDKGMQHLGPLKTPESYRELPLAPSAVLAVSAYGGVPACPHPARGQNGPAERQDACGAAHLRGRQRPAYPSVDLVAGLEDDARQRERGSGRGEVGCARAREADAPRAARLLCLLPDREERERQGRSGAAWAFQAEHHARQVHGPLADGRGHDRGRYRVGSGRATASVGSGTSFVCALTAR